MLIRATKLARVAMLIGSGLALVSAGCDGDASNGSSCTVTKADAGDTAVITCEDGTKTVITASATADGACKVTTDSDGQKKITCGDGSSIVVKDGKDGAKGE